MAFVKHARAMVVRPNVNVPTGLVRTASTDRNLVEQAREILGGALDPSQYLITHCTIVASVDVKPVPGIKTGTLKVGSKTINRKWAEYLITPETDQYINNNQDCFSREVLLKSYRTFIGGHNFQEHVQIEEQSKGRIIDAVARDIGDSIYVDILVATDRKNAQLVRDIESGELSTLSMGCFLPGTMVSLGDGTRIPIEEVVPGEMVLTHKGRAREVLNKQIRYNKWNLRHIEAVGVPGVISTTDTHPFFVYRAPTVCACGCEQPLPDFSWNADLTRKMTRRFKVGHDKNVFNPNNVYSLEDHQARKARKEEIMDFHLEEVHAGDLKAGDFLCFPRGSVEEIPVDGLTVGKARLLGYFLAEGSFLKQEGKKIGVEFSFSFSELDTYAAEVQKLLLQEFPGEGIPKIQVREDKGACAVYCYSAPKMAEWFFSYAGEYCSRKRLHEEVLKWPVEFQKNLLGTWLNGDGNLEPEGRVTSGTSTSYDLICQLHFLFSRVGIFTRMMCHISGASSEIKYAVNGGVVLRGEDGKLASFTLEIPQTQAPKIAGYTTKAVFDSKFKNQLRVLDDYIMFPITSIKSEEYEGWVHDMEVEEDHSYVVEGVAVHNCVCDSTQCTKCGNVAVDESELCDCIKYAKGNYFFDDQGIKRRIAELCGHPTMNETGGVRYIEASWVRVPAFTGAVLRNIITPSSVVAQSDSIRKILASPPTQWSNADSLKVASVHIKNAEEELDFGAAEDSPSEGEGDKAPAEDKDPLKDAEDNLYKNLKDRVVSRIEKELKDKGPAPAVLPEGSMSTNENISRMAYQKVVVGLTKVASSNKNLLQNLAIVNSAFGISVNPDIYKMAYNVGSRCKYADDSEYLKACIKTAGRPLTQAEARTLIRIGSLLSKKEHGSK